MVRDQLFPNHRSTVANYGKSSLDDREPCR